jgi:hypothetical protein
VPVACKDLITTLGDDVELYLDSSGNLDMSKMSPQKLMLSLDILNEASPEIYKLFINTYADYLNETGLNTLPLTYIATTHLALLELEGLINLPEHL